MTLQLCPQDPHANGGVVRVADVARVTLQTRMGSRDASVVSHDLHSARFLLRMADTGEEEWVPFASPRLSDVVCRGLPPPDPLPSGEAFPTAPGQVIMCLSSRGMWRAARVEEVFPDAVRVQYVGFKNRDVVAFASRRLCPNLPRNLQPDIPEAFPSSTPHTPPTLPGKGFGAWTRPSQDVLTHAGGRSLPPPRREKGLSNFIRRIGLGDAIHAAASPRTTPGIAPRSAAYGASPHCTPGWGAAAPSMPGLDSMRSARSPPPAPNPGMWPVPPNATFPSPDTAMPVLPAMLQSHPMDAIGKEAVGAESPPVVGGGVGSMFTSFGGSASSSSSFCDGSTPATPPLPAGSDAAGSPAGGLTSQEGPRGGDATSEPSKPPAEEDMKKKAERRSRREERRRKAKDSTAKADEASDGHRSKHRGRARDSRRGGDDGDCDKVDDVP
eukprot:TRINITY_DN35531_c0_g1_i1.p1 TRINITY_DN35531_c0_g1~~TRINITY_DN35531_c0_g1_i1.p1  ORF type:complete len:440 (-),score=33.86 TRINITY_DN35531_c0_g1_i1:443-1762(-)